MGEGGLRSRPSHYRDMPAALLGVVSTVLGRTDGQFGRGRKELGSRGRVAVAGPPPERGCGRWRAK